MILKLNEQWINLQVDHFKRLNELEINQTTIDTQEETIIKLWKKVLSLKKRQRSANQSQSQQSTKSQASIKNHTQQKLFTLFDNDHHKFFKFLNSFIFTDEDELT